MSAMQILLFLRRQDDQQHILYQFTGLAAKVCSLLLESGRPVEASVEILELGRGAISGLMIDPTSAASFMLTITETQDEGSDK
jgi:hypothetical protein